MDRRNFIKTSAFATAATVVPSYGLFASNDDTIKVALVGCGGRGTGAAGKRRL